MKTNLLLFVSLLCIQIQAQQDAQYTQYMYNTVIVNPAYAGTREAMSIFALHRAQWVGLEGAPQTNSLSLNTPLLPNVGVGLSVVTDKIGPSSENNIAADFSYSIPTSELYEISFGVKASINMLNIDFNKLNLQPGQDPTYQNGADKKVSPNVGIGFYYHSDITYIGISAPNLLETKHFDGGDAVTASSNLATEKINYYLIAGHVLDLSPSLKLKPTLQTKYVQGAPLEVDLSANFMINKKFIAGAAYRVNAAVSAMAGFQLGESLFVGYSYDFETTKLASYNSGSHEIFLRYELLQTAYRVVAPIFF